MSSVRYRRLLAVLFVILAAGPSCSLLDRGSGGYHLTAYFSRAIGLYPFGDVSVMGIGVGTVTAVELEDTHVRVEMEIDAGVPLPADVQATIEPLQLIGERNVVLFPAWNGQMAREGRERARDGDVIPLDRTQVPVEPDEGLEAFNDLARSLQPEVIGQFVSDSARALDGQGERINDAIGYASTLSSTLAGLDSQLVSAAESLHRLAGSLNTRGEQLSAIIDAFSEATGVLASERDSIATFLTSLVELTEQGNSILELYGENLPRDIANLTALMMIFEENASAIETLIGTFPIISEGLNAAYQPDIDGFMLRASATPSLVALLDALRDNLNVLPGEGG